MFAWRASTLAVAGLALTALTLAGCAGGSGDSEGKQTLTVAFRTAPSGESAYQQVAEQFMAAYPQYDVKIENYPSDSYADTIGTQLQAGNGPDVFYAVAGSGATNGVVTLADAGYVLDLSDQSWATDAITEANEQFFYSGSMLGALPLTQTPYIQIYNETDFADLGITAPDTIADLLADCQTASAAGKSYYGVAATVPDGDGAMVNQIAASVVYAADPDWNAKRQGGQTTFADSSEWQTVMQTILDMNDAGCFAGGTAGFDFSALTTKMLSSDILQAGGTTPMMGDLNAGADGVSFAAAPFPGVTADDTRLFLQTADALAINSKTESEDAALALLEYFAGSEGNQAFAAANNTLPIGSWPTSSNAGFTEINEIAADSDNIVASIESGWPAAVYQAETTGVQALLTGQSTPAQVLQAMDEAWS